MTGTLVACFCAGARLKHLSSTAEDNPKSLVQGNMLLGAISGVLAVTVAAEVAAARPDVKGPNTFRSALIDELYNLTEDRVKEKIQVEVWYE